MVRSMVRLPKPRGPRVTDQGTRTHASESACGAGNDVGGMEYAQDSAIISCWVLAAQNSNYIRKVALFVHLGESHGNDGRRGLEDGQRQRSQIR